MEVFSGEKEFVYYGFKLEKSKFENETILFNLKSSYTLNECVEESGKLQAIQKRFFSKCPLEIKAQNLIFPCQRGIHVQSNCKTDDANAKHHHEKVQSGDYFPFNIHNNRTIYRKSQPDDFNNYRFLSKELDGPWKLHWQNSGELVFGHKEIEVDESITG